MPRLFLVDCQHPCADDNGPGTTARPFQRIAPAAAQAQPGDRIRIAPGIYREQVSPVCGGSTRKPITYEAVGGGTTIIKGSDLWRPRWRAVKGRAGVYRAALPATVRRLKANPFATASPARVGSRCLGELFLRGHPLREADTEADLTLLTGAWRATATGDALLYRPANPKTDLNPAEGFELVVRPYIFAPAHRGLAHLVLRGLVLEHCANSFPKNFWTPEGWPQAGALSTRSGYRWRIEQCTVRWCKGLGLDCGAEGARDPVGNEPMPKRTGRHLIADCSFEHNGVGGIAGWRTPHTIIRDNLVHANNRLGFFAPEAAGIKVHQFFGGLISGNTVTGNDAYGIWVDNGYAGCRLTRNLCLGNRGAAIFIEMGRGRCIVDHNICGLTSRGEGIYVHDASDVLIAHNLVFNNAHLGIYARKVTERECVDELDPPHAEVGCSRVEVRANLFIDNYRGQLSLPLASPHSRDNQSDYNLFVSGAAWQWEGAREDRFFLNTNDGRIASSALLDALRKAFSNTPRRERPGAAFWLRDPWLPLAAWQAATGWDAHSRAVGVQRGVIEVGALAKGACGLAPLDATVHFRAGASLRHDLAPAHPELALDFYGRRRSGQHWQPGPFSTLAEGVSVFPLTHRLPSS
jgi:parallel beta-helix repeat protein